MRRSYQLAGDESYTGVTFTETIRWDIHRSFISKRLSKTVSQLKQVIENTRWGNVFDMCEQIVVIYELAIRSIDERRVGLTDLRTLQGTSGPGAPARFTPKLLHFPSYLPPVTRHPATLPPLPAPTDDLRSCIPGQTPNAYLFTFHNILNYTNKLLHRYCLTLLTIR
ncbi:unnamed protein product [Danaus chrysippus]|uniref:(African queen) hypothetical protein n=1 Tax=Danaus chrysippus TaxID=151541 RepID=A0A8J2QLH4_9NEOP|nr:unnamed protein product [Danaus chrysippus]